MPQNDVEEIKKQVDELVEAKLVAPYPVGKYPKYCSATFLVDKKESQTRRMVGQYVKLNKMTRPHAAYLPNMEEMVENLARCRFKSKMDLRSGFWQIGLSERAKEVPPSPPQVEGVTNGFACHLVSKVPLEFFKK